MPLRPWAQMAYQIGPPHVGEEPAGDRRGDVAGEIEDADAGEDGGHRRPLWGKRSTGRESSPGCKWAGSAAGL
jgi:hypothetical protein